MTAAHLHEGQLQQLLCGELPAADAQRLRTHLETCDTCRVRLDDASRDEQRVLGALGHLDHPLPRVSFEGIVTSARRRGRRHPVQWPWKWAAGIVLLLGGGGIAYALPGSPLPALARRVAAWLGRPGSPRVEVPVDGTTAAGVLLDAGAPAIIEFLQVQPGDTIVATVGDGAAIAVRARGGDVAFLSGVDRLTIRNRGGTSLFEIEIPQSAVRVEIRANGRTVLTHPVAGESPRAALGKRLVIPIGRR